MTEGAYPMTWTPAAVQAQPMPQPGQQEVLALVLADLQGRAQMGLMKYGTPLMTHNGREALQDLKQELLDALMYCYQLEAEQPHWRYPIGAKVKYQSAHAQTLPDQPWEDVPFRVIGQFLERLEGLPDTLKYLIQRWDGATHRFSKQLHRPIAGVWEEQLRPWEEKESA